MLRITRERKENKLAMYRLQIQLVADLFERQAVIKEAKRIIKDPTRISELVGEGSELDLNSLSAQIKQERLIVHVLREVVDGHLWRIFGFNRPVLYWMGREAKPGALQLSEGFFRELKSWSEAINELDITHFILCDITSFAGIGDVIIRNKDGQIHIKEIKSSKSRRGLERTARLKRQEENREMLEKLANSGKIQIADQTVGIIDTEIPYKNSLKLMGKALKGCESQGIEGRRLNSYLSIVCFDQQVAQNKQIDEDNLGSYLDNYHSSHFDDEDDVIPFMSLMRSTFSSGFTPWSIFPFSEALIADLMLGKKIISYGFNLSEFIRLLESENWRVLDLADSGPGPKPYFCRVKHKDLTIGISWTLLSQIVFDTLSLDSVFDFLKVIYDRKLTSLNGLFVHFDENKPWC
jgi:hypothetical protein